MLFFEYKKYIINKYILSGLTLSFMATASTAIAATEVQCRGFVDRNKVFDGQVQIVRAHHEPEGSGSAVFYTGEGFRFFIEKYPVAVGVQIVDKSGVVLDVLRNGEWVSAWQFIRSNGGHASSISTSAETLSGEHDFKVECKELEYNP
ncbi:MAG TPA: hypothetical protein PLU50_05490 [Pseudobdellovibrionaceae bacterium]|nr:hypothetical protein [Pseudobdellovibrionaceae bacterium]